MTGNQPGSSNDAQKPIPPNPIISDTMHRDTLDRVVQVIELLEELDLSQGLSPGASAGLYWIHGMLIDTLRYVSASLKQPVPLSGPVHDASHDC